MGKKDRNRQQPKKNNHVSTDVEISKEIAHGEEKSAQMRKPIQKNRK